MNKLSHRFSRRSMVATGAGFAAGIPLVGAAKSRSLLRAQSENGGDAALDAVLKVTGVAGAAVFFGNVDDDPVSVAMGVTDLETGTPVTLETYFRIGSITKTFVATVVLQLVDEGKLLLENTIDTFNVPVQNAPFISIRNLLNMTSGLADYINVPSFLEIVLADPERNVSPQELIDVTGSQPAGLPNNGYQYVNANYIILGTIIEQITGISLAENLQERLFTPLAMTSTALQMGEARPEPFAHGYGRADQVAMFVGMDGDEADALAEIATPLAASDGVIDFTYLNPGFAWAAGGAYSTVGDLTLWMPALVNGTMISEAMQRERLELVTVGDFSGPFGGYGLGVGAFGESLGHSGTIPGYSTFAVIDRRTGKQQIILTSLTGSGGAGVAAELLGTALRGLFGW